MKKSEVSPFNTQHYKVAFHSEAHNIDLFMPVDIAQGYHISRYIAAGAQNIYSGCGINKDLLSSMLNQIIDWCNDDKIKTVRTNVAALANNLLYRTKYPVDEDCAVRMGATLCFLLDESPEEVHDLFTRKKMDLAKGSLDGSIKPDTKLYDFFLHTGLAYTDSWKGLEEPLTESYFKDREEKLNSLMPKELYPQK